MKPLLFLSLGLLPGICIAQHYEIRSVEYVWERQNGDNRIVFGKYTKYQQALKQAVIKAAARKFKDTLDGFDVSAYKLPAMRSQPKFNGTVENRDTSSGYIFLQLFDKSMQYEVQQYSAYTGFIEARYRMIKGSALQTKTVTFRIVKTNVPGEVRLKRYLFDPSSFQIACDTIAEVLFGDSKEETRDLCLPPACGYNDDNDPIAHRENFKYDLSRQSITVTGEHSFTISQDSVVVLQTGSKKHAAANTASGLLTVLSNIDSEKKRSGEYTADHKITEGAHTYHCYVSYTDTRVAERRRIKDEEGYKSVAVGEYQHGWREIDPRDVHVITLNGDTLSTFNIIFHRFEDRFAKMWNGRDSASIDSLPAENNNPPGVEMEMKGLMKGKRFDLLTRDDGKIKRLMLDGEFVYAFNSTGGQGELLSRNMDPIDLKLATVLCFLADKYY